MPFKTYKYKNKKTGEVISIPWDKPNKPTPRDIKKIVHSRKVQKAAPPVSTNPIRAAIGNVIFAPSDIIGRPKEMYQEEVEKLPLFKEKGKVLPLTKGTRMGRIGQVVAGGLSDPSVLARMALLPIAGPATRAFPILKGVAQAVKPAVAGSFAGEMIPHAPNLYKEAWNNPSLESVSFAALNALGILGTGVSAGAGLRSGLKVKAGKAPGATPKKVAVPKRPQLTAGQKLLASRAVRGKKVSPASGKTIIVRPPSGQARLQAGSETKLLPSGKGQPLLPEGTIHGEGFSIERLPPEVTRGPQFTVEAPGKPIPLRPPGPVEVIDLGPTRKSKSIDPTLDTPVETAPVGTLIKRVEPLKPPITKVTGNVKTIEQRNAKAKQQYEKYRDRVDKTMGAQKGFYDKQSDAVLKMLRKGATEKVKDKIDDALKKRKGETGVLRFEGSKAARIANAAAKEKIPSKADVKADKAALSNVINTWLAPIPVAIKRFGNNSRAAGELGRILQFERTERNRIRGVYNDAAHKSGVQSHRGGVDNLTDAEIGNYSIRDLQTGKVKELIQGDTVGANEAHFVTYEAGIMKAKPGFELLKPMPGNLIDVMEKGAMPANPKVAAAAKGIRKIDDEMGMRAEAKGLGARVGESKVLPFKRMEEGHFPHRYSRPFFESLDRDPTAFDGLIKRIAEREKITEAQARSYINESRKQGEILSAPQHARLTEHEFFIRDRSVIFNHIKDLGDRLGRAETLGPLDINGPKIQGLLNQIAKDGGDTAAIGSLVERVVGRDQVNPFRGSEKHLYRGISKVLTARYLPFFAISNLATLGNIAIRGNFRRLLPAIVHNFRVKDRLSSANTRSGALTEYLTDELAPQSIFSKLYKIKGSEQFLRSTAAEVGRGKVRDTLEFIKEQEPGSYNYNSAYKQLKNQLLKNDKQMAELLARGKLTNREVDFAGGRMAEMTQGLVDPVDLPYHWSGGTQNLLLDQVFTYKRFAYQSTKNLIDGIKENPTRAGALYAAMSPLIGEALGDTKAAVKGLLASITTDEEAADAVIREIERRGDYLKRVSPFFKEHPHAARLVDSYLNSWAFGLIPDVMLAAVDDTGGISDFITGPFISLLQDISGSVWGVSNELYQDPSINWTEIEKNIRRLYPGSMGGAISRSEKTESKGTTSSGLPSRN